jgi:hypothetical protein
MEYGYKFLTWYEAKEMKTIDGFGVPGEDV